MTSTMLAGMLPALLLFDAFFLLYITVRLVFWNKSNQNRRSPLTKQLLRGPGESLREAIDDLRWDALGYLFLAVLGPVLVYSAHLSLVHYGGKRETPLLIVISSVSGLAVFGHGLREFIRLRRLIDPMREGLDGEVAVGQELNQLLRDGFWVFHDVVLKDFNVDHVVVGATGIFAVETKMRKKPTTTDRKADAQVEYDGTSLKFPDWADKKSLEQALRQSSSLAKWLREATGDLSLKAHPILALPGWYVKVTANLTKMANVVSVINPTNLHVFKKNYGSLSEQQIRCVVYQLDRLCRDIDPYEAGKEPEDFKKKNTLANKARAGS